MRKILIPVLLIIAGCVVGYFFAINTNPSVTGAAIVEDIDRNSEGIGKTASVDEIEMSIPKKSLDDYPNITEIHWAHMPLTYSFENECIERITNLTRTAFKTIESETEGRVRFNETSISGDISIYCKNREYVKDADTIALGEAFFYTEPLNENLITHANITFYGQGQVCGTGYPALEAHEILHTFGVMDDGFLDRLMSMYSSESSKACKIKNIDKPILSCLNYIYSNGQINGTCPEMLKSSDFQFSCKSGWYEVKGTSFCCPEPNMVIDEEGNCNYL